MAINEQFKKLGQKTITITDTAIIYGKEKYTYEELLGIHIYSGAGLIANGTIAFKTKKGDRTWMFDYGDRFKVAQLYDLAITQFNKIHDPKCKMQLTASTFTTLKIYNDYLILNFMPAGSQILNCLSGGGRGDKKIYYSDMTAIQYKQPLGITLGALQISFPGGDGTMKNFKDLLEDSNAFPVDQFNAERIKSVVNFIEKKRKGTRMLGGNAGGGSSSASPSAADEIMKYKKLLDAGAITAKEYNEKKKQLLDL